MNAALRKEIRLLLPAWIVAMGAATAPVWIMGKGLRISAPELMEDTFFVLFSAGALLLSLSSFGSEMSFGTFPSLLAQPRPRLATWRMKTGLLALALAVVTLAAGLSWWLRLYAMGMEATRMEGADRWLPDYQIGFWILDIPDNRMLCILLPLAVIAFVSGLWTTLLFRQTLTAFWITIIAPLVLFWPWIKEGSWNRSFALAFCGYGLVGYFLARWLFLHAQDRQSNAVAATAQWTFLPAFRRTRWPAAALFSKELRLQQGIMLFACILALLDLAALAVLKCYGPSEAASGIIVASCTGWIGVPLLVGCVSIAEERQSRTLESALCLPVARRTQFLIKLAVVFGLGIFLGAVLPWSLLQLRPGEEWERFATVFGLLFLLLVAAFITAAGCYASSLSRTLLHAFGTAIVLSTFLLFAISVFDLSKSLTWVFDNHTYISSFVLIALCSCLSYGNFKQLRIDWRNWFRVALILLAAIILLLIVGSISVVIFYRRTSLH